MSGPRRRGLLKKRSDRPKPFSLDGRGGAMDEDGIASAMLCLQEMGKDSGLPLVR